MLAGEQLCETRG